jgi:Methyltransferase domain
MASGDLDLDQVRGGARDRLQFWSRFLGQIDARSVAEVGVWRGEFAESILRSCPQLERYYMVDAWRHLEGWNKPANTSDVEFEKIMAEALRRTEFAREERIVLRGRTAEVLDRIPDQSLDFAYIDSDHSLRGITLDLFKILPKMRPNGWIGGDDFEPNVWQHPLRYEPTFVFPYAVYFAEAIGAVIYAVGFNQFLMSVPEPGRESADTPAFVDRTGQYRTITVAPALRRPAPWRPALRVAVHRGRRLVRRPQQAMRHGS